MGSFGRRLRDGLAWGGWPHYGLALLVFAVASLVNVGLTPLIHETPPAVYLLAVGLTAWVAGPGPALLASVLGTAGLYYFYRTLQGWPAIDGVRGVIALGAFAATSLIVASLAAARRRAERAHAAAVAREAHAHEAARAVEHRSSFLAEVGTLLASSLDFDTALDNLARMAVAWGLADWCLVDVYDVDGSLRRVAAIHGDPDKQPLVTELQQRYQRLAPRSPHTLWKVLVPEQPWIDAVVDPVRLEAEARDPDHFRLLRDIGFKSEMVVPLAARGRTLGAITLVRGTPEKPYGDGDLRLAQELARRAGLAADNARLYAEAQRLNAVLEERVRERTAQLEQQVAEHEATLRTLRENERRLAEAQQIAHLGSWHHELATDRQTWSDQLFRICSLEPQSEVMTAARYLEMVHPEDRERVNDLMDAAIRAGTSFDFEHRLVWPDGQVRTIHTRGTVTVGADGSARAIEGTAQDITERQQLAAELVRSHAELTRLSAHLQTAREEERARIAREIHDELGGSLTGVKMDVARLRRLGSAGSPQWLAQAEAVSAALDATVKTVRRIATELRPAILDDFGLVAAIEWQLNEFRQRSGLACELQAGLEQVNLDRDSATAIFRVFQETLTNVARHAQASRVRVRLYEQPGGLVLVVQDNGRGMDTAMATQGNTFGLMGMRERVRMLSGQLEIQGEPGQGTTVRVRVPLPSANGHSAGTPPAAS
jgi:signal transduction histidine kinase/GAF domain-containing protein